MTALQERARAFLERPIPPELADHYVPGSITEMLIGHFVAGLPLDPEGQELLGLCAAQAEVEVDQHQTEEAKAYFHECASILAAMEAEQPAV